ncbi:transposase [Arthrobacter sp. CAN_A6]|uniref:transposase n=1 Tax=Arthrobacter sp. CAN_A6 TaxID=2787721 RepID=UPI0018CA28C4
MELHVICDNYATHKHQNINDWLTANPRVSLHFATTSCSWLNMVEIFFGLVTRQSIKRGSFHSVQDLEETIERYIDNYNESATSFRWIKTADHLLGKIKRKQTTNT